MSRIDAKILDSILKKTMLTLREMSIGDEIDIRQYRRKVSNFRFNDRFMKIILKKLEEDGFVKTRRGRGCTTLITILRKE